MRHRLFTVKFGAAGCAAARRRMVRFRLRLRTQPPHGTGRIQLVQETNPSRSSAPDERRPGLPMDESRLLMMRRPSG
jgi:hypothetical protein